jgi:multisubunit Na+/H+ antiporter MnhE subunit
MNSTELTMAVMSGGIAYVTIMFFYNKVKNGETFNASQYAETLGYISLVAVAAYVANGVIPDFGAILQQVQASTPDSSTLLALITAVLAYFYKHFTSSSAVAVPSVVTTKPFNPGFKVVPTETTIASGATASITVTTGTQTSKMSIDWLDGSTPQTVPLVKTSAGMTATLTHVYTFVKDAHYTGHTFYPKFTLSDDSGNTLVFNDVAGGQGADCAIYVNSL